jgi:hypothetical protein
MNLDGETNLKERFALIERLDDKSLANIKGFIICDAPNENLEKWDARI